jgi:hypothetical protein
MVIIHDNKIHQAAVAVAESNRQTVVNAAGSSAAANKAAEIAFYRAVIVSCKLNNLPFISFSQALFFLGTDGT